MNDEAATTTEPKEIACMVPSPHPLVEVKPAEGTAGARSRPAQTRRLARPTQDRIFDKQKQDVQYALMSGDDPPKDSEAAELGRSRDMAGRKTTRRCPTRTARVDFQKASLDELLSALEPVRDDTAIRRLLTLLIEAQESPPADKAAFVRDVNRLLDLLDLRISANGETPGRLALTAGRSIQLTVSGRGSRGFKNATIQLVRIPDRDVGKQRVVWPTTLEPAVPRQ